MKKGLLGSTALVAATALTAGMAQAAEAPTASWSGSVNFQAYYVDNSATGLTYNGLTAQAQDEAPIFFGVDEAEIQLNVKGTADNGLNYGFKIELNANTSADDANAADEARVSLGGSWGTLHLGDEDGAEDIMNYGGETIMGATGGFDGDWADAGAIVTLFAPATAPTMAGDTSDHTKVSYYSPRFSGFQVGASYTPSGAMDGNEFKQDGANNNSYALGANYDGTFGSVRVRASAVYVTDDSKNPNIEGNSAYSVGGIVGFGPVSVGANYTDNGESGWTVGAPIESSYWDVAGAYEAGPIYLSAGYFVATTDVLSLSEELSVISLTADYSMAPGLTVYAELNFIENDIFGAFTSESDVFIVGTNVSF